MIGRATFATTLAHTADVIREAAKNLDRLCASGPDHLADQLNAVAGQGDLEVIADRLSRLALQINADEPDHRPALLWSEIQP